MQKQQWLVTANSSVAHIYQVEKKTTLVEIKTLTHPESRSPDRDLVSDKPGRDFESMGKSRHSLEPHTSHKELASEAFAKELASYLEKQVQQGTIERVDIVASPSFLGQLRSALLPATKKITHNELDKDMTHIPAQQIPSQLPFLL